MVRQLAATVALLALLGGCTEAPMKVRGELAAPSSEPTATPPAAEPAPSPPPAVGTPAQARRKFRRIQDTFFRTGRGNFYTRMRMSTGGEPIWIEHEGSYDLVGLRADYEISMDFPAGSIRTQVRAEESDAWFSFLELPQATPRAGCWVHMDTGVLADATDLQIPEGPGLGFPSDIVAVATGRVTGYYYDDLAGTADLATVASLYGAETVSRLGIPWESEDRVPVVFDLEDGELVGWSADLKDVVSVARRAGYLPRSLRRLVRRHGLESFGGRAEVALENTGKAWTFEPPPTKGIIEMSADESFETAMRSCTGVGQSGA